MGISSMIGIGTGLLGGVLGGKKGPTSQTTTENSTRDGTESSSMSSQLNGNVGSLVGLNGGGLLGRLGAAFDGGSNVSGAANGFLNANSGQILNNGYAATNALQSYTPDAPTIEGAQVRAPGQNNLNLAGAFDRTINGAPGANPYLDASISGAIAQNRLGFQQLQDDSTENLLGSILPSIRSGAIASGQFGGSRQGIAEGNAIGTAQRELARAAAQFGQNATNAAVGAKANAYETDSNRALSAMQGLSAHQYGVAQQDAAARQAADNTNVQALLATRGQNASNMATGISLQQGLLGSAAGLGNNDLGRMGAIGGILAPYLNAGATVNSTGTTSSKTSGTSTQPIQQDRLGGAIGGASSALGLLGKFSGFF
ncbi:hypothetical protein [Pseudoduganella chitinolytica]|uniref:DNA transfer protein n=1 Tax=Pseudoduganella chitinolytica TaxID=34070 RepID=A0ABY8BGA3_9BURK|nr:hypothetical protein [Pseudoduganella chitinolytica]WEF34855.1 hypothetical protein PX653_08865 [Pseudoduganella chitinolytica]